MKGRAGRPDENLNKIADQISKYVCENERYFNARQKILAHRVKNQLVDLIELVAEGKHRQARKLLLKIETDIVSIFKQNPRR